MTDREKQRREIERDEQWLTERLGGRSDEALAGFSLPRSEAIKKRVRLEIQEGWLEQNLEDDVPRDLAERLKAKTLAALRERSESSPAKERSKAARGRWRLMVGWGLAAAACLGIYVGVRPVGHDGLGGSVTVLPGDPFGEYQEDELLVSLTRLGDDFDDLEYSLSEQGGFDAADFLLDDLLFEMDRVATDDDWSS